MTNTKGIVSFPQPANYDLIRVYADTAKTNFDLVRKLKPKDIEAAKKAWYQFLDYCKFENIIPNKGYIKALGLKVQ